MIHECLGLVKRRHAKDGMAVIIENPLITGKRR